MILEYLKATHIEDCVYILSKEDDQAYYSVKVDFIKLFESYPDVGDKVLCNPLETIPACNRDVILAQKQIMDLPEYKHLISKLQNYCLKTNVHTRFFGLPVCPELHRTIFPKNVDLGCFLKVNGTVVRVTQAKMLEYQRKYVCVKCKHENLVQADFESRYILKAPTKCGNTESRCKCTTFTQVNLVSRKYCKDYQEIKIQEQVNKLNIGTIPGSMWVVLEDDLVDCCKPGDDVIICGVVRRRWRPCSQTKRSEVELVLHANYVDVINAIRSDVVASAPDVKGCFDEFWAKYEKCPLKGRDRILESVCPQVYGLHLVKLAVLLTVITGSNHVLESDSEKRNVDDIHATRVRGQCHLLLVGDPGTGKSQLLRAGADLTARSVFTSGAGSTRAGLTCAALREGGEWQLEAGALVLSDGGVCCIDEISHLRDHDRTAIHEAMEQQTISIAKAGIVCKLNTRCAVIAACNPKGNYQTDQPLSVNVSLGTPLLSRFDLIFILLDSKNKHWDKLVSSYILFGGNSECKKRWSIEKLQMYISLIGPKQMEMTKSANTILQHYYMSQRKSVYRDPSRTTVRMLDSLVRLSQAHCRLMYRTTILPVDAIMAISLVDLSMQDCTLSDTSDALHSTFQKYPDYEYLIKAKKILNQLNLYEIWTEELLYYAKLLKVDHKTLESEINCENSSIFAQVDDIEDSNIQLSATLITSSYFNNKNNMKIQKDVINSKLAETLVKHAALNKNVRIPTVQKRTKNKRKHIIIDTNAEPNERVINKKKKTKVKRDIESDEDFDVSKALNAVPSVNDVFNDLGMEFNDLDVPQDENDNPHSLCMTNEQKSNDKDQVNLNICTINEVDKDSTRNKLEQFEFKSKTDLNKYFDDTVKREVITNTALEIQSLNNTCEERKAYNNSKISMFETDCDIDLDI